MINISPWSTLTDYKFTGKELDSETDLYYYEAIYYDPTGKTPALVVAAVTILEKLAKTVFYCCINSFICIIACFLL